MKKKNVFSSIMENVFSLCNLQNKLDLQNFNLFLKYHKNTKYLLKHSAHKYLQIQPAVKENKTSA